MYKYKNYDDRELSFKEQTIASAIFIWICLLLLFIIDAQWTLKIFALILWGIVAFFTSIWWLIVSVPLWVWLLLLILK